VETRWSDPHHGRAVHAARHSFSALQINAHRRRAPPVLIPNFLSTLNRRTSASRRSMQGDIRAYGDVMGRPTGCSTSNKTSPLRTGVGGEVVQIGGHRIMRIGGQEFPSFVFAAACRAEITADACGRAGNFAPQRSGFSSSTTSRQLQAHRSISRNTNVLSRSRPLTFPARIWPRTIRPSRK